jgi:hypothetical protein
MERGEEYQAGFVETQKVVFKVTARCIFARFMRPTEDSYRHKGLRKKLVQGIHAKGITDDRVLDAILEVPRHFFLDSAFDEKAYEDRAFPIGEGQTISQPYTVAYQSQLLKWEHRCIPSNAKKNCLIQTSRLIF